MATLGHTVLYEGPWLQFIEGLLDDGVESVRNVPLVNAIDIPHIPFDPPGAHVTVPYFLAFTPETPSSLGPTDLTTHACPLVPRDINAEGPSKFRNGEEIAARFSAERVKRGCRGLGEHVHLRTLRRCHQHEADTQSPGGAQPLAPLIRRVSTPRR